MKKPILASALKIFFGAVLFTSGIGRENAANTLIPMILGGLLIWWGVRPLLPAGRQRKAPDAANPANAQPFVAAGPGEDVKYPFKNMGMAHACEPSDFIVVDTETTGFSPREDKIIELAAIKVRGDDVVWFHSLVNPGRRIPKRSGVYSCTHHTEMV